jgi:predicted MFS family arabinose efflux permease
MTTESTPNRTGVALRLPRPRTIALWAAHALAWALGIAFGFHFGWRVSGAALGVVTALLSGICLSLLLDATTEGAERLATLWDRRRSS